MIASIDDLISTLKAEGAQDLKQRDWSVDFSPSLLRFPVTSISGRNEAHAGRSEYAVQPTVARCVNEQFKADNNRDDLAYEISQLEAKILRGQEKKAKLEADEAATQKAKKALTLS